MMSAYLPIISVVVPTYNAESFVSAAIQSVLDQTFKNLELVIIDDASADGTPGLVAGLASKDARIVFERFSVNQGSAAARNRAMALSHGRYVAFLDSDDLWEPNKLERQMAFMEAQGAGFCYTGYRVISREGEELDVISSIPSRLGYSDYLKNTVIGCSTVMLDRERVGDVRFPDIRTRQDFALWLSLLRAGHTAYGLDEILTSYRINPNSISRNKRKAAMQVWHVMRRNERLPLLKATWYFGNYAVRGLLKHLRAR
jgi:teichuronic acid biosynthesis glycosyltransferase TuaG